MSFSLFGPGFFSLPSYMLLRFSISMFGIENEMRRIYTSSLEGIENNSIALQFMKKNHLRYFTHWLPM